MMVTLDYDAIMDDISPTNEMTEQEYLQTCNTEQLAEFLIASIKKCKSCASGIGADEVADCPFGECGCHFKDEVVEWLKQPHTKGVTDETKMETAYKETADR